MMLSAWREASKRRLAPTLLLCSYLLLLFSLATSWQPYYATTRPRILLKNLIMSASHVASELQQQVQHATPSLEAINREDFPILQREAYPGKPIIFLDSGASSQKPNQVLDVMDRYYKTNHANVHRGAYSIASQATEQFEHARTQVQHFIHAQHREEIVFTRGATEAINLFALSYGQRLQAGDEIILSVMEHHSNMVPWQLLAKQTGAVLKFVQLTPDMTFDFDHYCSMLSSKTKIVSVAYASNVLGIINPVEDIIKEAHQHGAVVLLDACQAVPHMPVDVQSLNVDALVASSHKMCGPTGIGFLYAKLPILDSMPPVYGGGEMIDQVELHSSTYAAPPARFEAGTPAIAEAIGLGAACAYLQQIGMQRIFEHEKVLGRYLYERLASIPDLVLFGPNPLTSGVERSGLVAFNHKKIHATDLSFFLDQEGVCVRTGHHCAQPLHKLLGAAGSMRASLYFYNNQEDVDKFIEKLQETIKMFEGLELM